MPPRNVRNFWLELDIDGRKSRIATGPVNTLGGFSLVVKARNRGEVCEAFVIHGVVKADHSTSISCHPSHSPEICIKLWQGHR